MATQGFQKINDLSDSPLRKRFHNDGEYKPTSNDAVTFGRVSIIKNKNSGNSDLAQKENMGDYVQSKHLRVVKEWDIAETAFVHEDRRQFVALDRYLRANPSVKHVVFSHVSRACRNKKSANMIEDWVLELGIVVHFARENMCLHMKSDQSVWIIWHVKVTQHESESENTRKNVWDGMIKSLEKGVYPARGPYGYRNIRTEAKEAAFEFNGDKATYMRRAFERFSTGSFSVPALKRELDREFSHLRTPNKKQLEYLLKNPFYYGDFEFGDRLYHGNRDYHPILVPYELWKRVQDVFKRPGRSKRKVTQRSHPYTGLIKCDGRLLDENGVETEQVCGAAISCEEKRRKYKNGTEQRFYYYRCSRSTGQCSQQNAAFLKTHGRDKLNYTEGEIERLMQRLFSPMRFDEEVCRWMQEVLLEEHRTRSHDHKQQMAALRHREQMLHQYIDKAYEDKLKGLITEQMWREKNDGWRSQLLEVENQLRGLADLKDEYIQNGVLLIELAQRSESIYESAPPEKKRRMVEIVSSNLRLRNGTLCFEMKKPFDLLVEGRFPEKWRTLVGEYRNFVLQERYFNYKEVRDLAVA